MKTQAESKAPNRIPRRIGAVLTTLVAVMLFASASAKFAHVPSVVGQLAAMGIAGNRLTFVATLEVLSALLFLIPTTRSAGLLLVSAFMGGAIATHLQHSQLIAAPSMVLCVAWLGTWLRHPEVLWSWNRRDSSLRMGELSQLEELSALGELK